MKQIISLFLVIIAIALMATPFLMSSTTNDKISIGANLVGALASLITLLIAVLLFSKYGIEKTALTKQIETALRFLSELKKMRFIIRGKDYTLLFLSLDNIHIKHFKNYYDRELLFGTSYVDGLDPIWQISEDIFLPRAIAEKMNLLKVEIIQHCQTEKKHMEMSVAGYSSKDDTMMGIINRKSITLGEYIALWDSVIKTSIEWVDKHSDIELALNFHTGSGPKERVGVKSADS